MCLRWTGCNSAEWPTHRGSTFVRRREETAHQSVPGQMHRRRKWCSAILHIQVTSPSQPSCVQWELDDLCHRAELTESRLGAADSSIATILALAPHCPLVRWWEATAEETSGTGLSTERVWNNIAQVRGRDSVSLTMTAKWAFAQRKWEVGEKR